MGKRIASLNIKGIDSTKDIKKEEEGHQSACSKNETREIVFIKRQNYSYQLNSHGGMKASETLF